MSLPPKIHLAGRVRRLRELWAARSLVRYLTGSSLRVESVNLWFGFVWWCLDPLLLMLVYTLVVSVVLHRGGPNFPLFVLSALLPWQFFVRANRNSIAATLSSAQTMRQVAFPRAVVPLATALAEFVRLVAAMVLFVAFAIAFGVWPTATDLVALPLLGVLLLITLGIAYFLSALNIFVRDTGLVVGHVFRLLFFLSPVLYATQKVPERFRLWFQLNPFAEILEGFRSTLFRHQMPSAWPLVGAAAATLVIFAAGFVFFVATERSFVKQA